jgi:RNA polymerase sigma factor for flagellar operon FliA
MMTTETRWDDAPATREETIVKYVSLVHFVVGRIMMTLPESVDKEDLVSCGLLGLISAVDRFDPTRGVKFDTYATQVIRGAVMEALRAEDWAPRSVREKCRRLERTVASLEGQLARPPEDREIAGALELDLDDYYDLLSDVSSLTLVSLEELLTPDEVPAGASPADESPVSSNPAAIAQGKELRRLLAEAIRQLPERERTVIALYYYEELTLKEIGAVLGVTESRVCQIHTQSIVRLRAKLHEATRLT